MKLEASAHRVKIRCIHEQSQDRDAWKGWLNNCNAAVAPLVIFDSKEKLQLREAMYATYAIVGLFTKTDHIEDGRKETTEAKFRKRASGYVPLKEPPPSGSLRRDN